jgi:hypothetical protein
MLEQARPRNTMAKDETMIMAVFFFKLFPPTRLAFIEACIYDKLIYLLLE